MGFLSIFLGIVGVGFGFVIGACIGFYFFIYSNPKFQPLKDPAVRSISELDLESLHELVPEIPLWLKNPDYDRVDWLNKFILYMWPYLDKAICASIRQTAEPMVADYIGNGHRAIEAITFETLCLGTLPPTFQGVKVYETNENQLVMEPAIKWAGNSNIVIAVKVSSLCIKIQLVDLQVFALPRITLKPLVPIFPCFSNVVVSLMEKVLPKTLLVIGGGKMDGSGGLDNGLKRAFYLYEPHVDFGLKVLGGDVMSIPGLYRLVQDIIKKEVAKLYLWPQSLDIPILDSSLGIVKRPVGVLHVRVLRATKLMKMDILGLSDPYVKLKLSGEMLPSKKTTIKKKTLNPVWNETFKLVVKDPDAQTLQINVYDWDKVGSHDRLGMQVVPLKLLTPNKTMELTLDLLKNTNIMDPHKHHQRGQIMLEMTYSQDDHDLLSEPPSPVQKGTVMKSGDESPSGAGVLLVTVQGAEDVEGDRHNNPYAVVIFRGETKKTKIVKRTRDPRWNEEFQFMMDEPPTHDKIHVQVMSKRTRMSFFSKEKLGHVDINLSDVVYNGRINDKFHLIDSKNGVVHVELRWRET